MTVNEQQRRTIRILLIEDNPSDACIIKELLAESREIDFDLREASSMVTAEGYLAVEQFDVILLDLRLPDSMEGESLVRAMTAGQGTPVLVVTARCDASLASVVREALAWPPFLKGDLKREELVRAIRDLAHRSIPLN